MIKDARLLHPEDRTVTEGHVLVEKGVIKKIVPLGAPLPRASATFDAGGKFVMPGLADMHTHLFLGNTSPHGGEPDQASQEQLGNRYLFAGVTTYLDLFAPNDAGDDPKSSLGGGTMNIFELRDRQRAGTIVHPNSFAAGPIFMVPGSHGVEDFLPGDVVRIQVTDEKNAPLDGAKLEEVAASAATRVRRVIEARHPDVIKIVFDNHEDSPGGATTTMPLPVARAIIAAAKERRVKTVAHVGTWAGVEALARIGVAAVTHLPNGAAPQSTIAALREGDVTAISTMALYQDYGDMIENSNRDAFVKRPYAKALAAPDLLAAYQDFAGYDDGEKEWVRWGAKHNQLGSQRFALQSLFKGGVRILPGTDSGNTMALFGYSVARELVRFAEAEIPPWEVLRAATVESQRFLGRKSGALAEGFAADLIVLEKNPLDGMENLQTVAGVILRGKLVDRGNLSVINER